MKKLLFVTLTLTLACIALVNTGCIKVDFNDGQVIDTTRGDGTGGVPTVLQGTIRSNLFLPKGKYTLRGDVFVSSGATLTIAPGTVILADPSVRSLLLVEVGGKLIAEGTATEPIVFTSGKPVGQRSPSDWGGISICGAAPTNWPLSPAPVTEGGTAKPYGGTNPNDNSGVLKYVRIEFAGITAEKDSELNGLSLYGVGAGTVIDFVQTAYCSDDGFEFFGGTVNAKHLFSFASGDDDFDFDNGFSGAIQFAVCLRDSANVDSDRMNAVECDNNANGTTAMPLTRPVLSNFTLIGASDSTAVGNTAGGSGEYGNGGRWRRNTRFVLRNSVLLGLRRSALVIEDAATINGWIAGESVYRDNLVHSYATNPYETNSQSILTNAALRTQVEAAGCITLNSRRNILTDPFNLRNPNFVPVTGSPALTGATFNGDLSNNFFLPVAYKGAFGAENWLTGWATFDPKNNNY